MAPAEKTNISLLEKLSNIRASLEFIKKEKRNNGYYAYVSSSDVLIPVRAAMAEQRLLLIPTVTNAVTREKPGPNGKIKYLTEVWVDYTWINLDAPDERLVTHWYSLGEDDAEKGIGKAYTYGERYFLLKFFQIPTDEDDPELHQKKENKRDMVLRGISGAVHGGSTATRSEEEDYAPIQDFAPPPVEDTMITLRQRQYIKGLDKEGKYTAGLDKLTKDDARKLINKLVQK